MRGTELGRVPSVSYPTEHANPRIMYSILEIFLRARARVCVSGEEMQISLIDGDGEAGL